jgi:hypothetical protein
MSKKIQTVRTYFMALSLGLKLRLAGYRRTLPENLRISLPAHPNRSCLSDDSYGVLCCHEGRVERNPLHQCDNVQWLEELTYVYTGVC